ncbi:MAG: GNAT family N-acetyltransferase [Cyanobacteria bacterium P01_E01_bin.35]
MMNLLQIKTVRYQAAKDAIRQIRTKVFQEEQGVAEELEFDGWDETVVHLLACLEEKAIGTARIREIDADTFKIERLAVLPEYRKQGVGKQLMETAIKTISQSQASLVVVHAQAYITQLYLQLGFEIVGDRFDEAGISHVKMMKQL